MNEQITELYSYLHGMWRHRWSALIVTWLVAIAAGMYVMAMPNQYSAKAVVYIDTTSIMKPLLKGLAPETDASNEISVMSRVLLSRDNLLSVIRDTDMNSKYITPESREQMVKTLEQSIGLKQGGDDDRWKSKTNIYEISYQASSADLAYQVVTKLLNSMIEGTLDTKRIDIVTVQKFLDRQITEHEERLTLAELELAKFKKSNVGYMPDEKGGYYERLQRAQDDVQNTRSALRLAERRHVELSKQLSGEKPLLGHESYESPTVSRIRLYQGQLDTLLNQYTEQHPDVLALRSTIADLEAANQTMQADFSEPAGENGNTAKLNPVYQDIRVELSKAGVEVETLKLQLADYEKRVNDLSNSIDVIPEVEAQLSKLNRDYEITRERYLDLVERKEAAKLSQNAGLSASDVTFRIIEPPIVPIQASGPPRILLMIGALLAAFAAGLGWSFLQYRLQPTFITLQQVRQGTGLPVLGSISLYLTPQHRRKRHWQLASFLSATILLLCVYGGTIYKTLI